MDELLRQIVEDFGSLVSVIAATQFPPPMLATHASYDAIELKFENGTVTIEANPDDDTVIVQNRAASFAHKHVLTQTEPWSQVIGCHPIWTWFLRNHIGSTDGFQIEFKGNKSVVDVQLMCEASSLSVRTFSV